MDFRVFGRPAVSRWLTPRVASASVILLGGARSAAHHAENAILILGRKLQRREARFGQATVGFDGLEDPAYVSRVRYTRTATQGRDIGGLLAYQSAVMNLTALPPDFEISFWILVAARPPPAPPWACAVPRRTCVTERRPRAMECLAPCAANICFSLWSETRGAVEPLM
jgi:hypothetical protein